jgi:transcriptional antiterminator/mannitol/fructose-specific phosphotransferase system IIA component (Ntr-type)
MSELNERQTRIVKLIVSSEDTTAAALANTLGVSVRTVYSDLKIIKPVFAEYGVLLKAVPRKGIEYEGSAGAVQKLFAAVGLKSQGIPDDDAERETYILTQLLRSSGYISMEVFARQLFVGRRTVERNLAAVERTLALQNVKLERKPSQGVRVIATESKRRNLFFRMLNRYWGESWQVSNDGNEKYHGSEGFATILPDKTVHQLLEIVSAFAKQRGITFSDYSYQSLVIHLAIAIRRVAQGNEIRSIDDPSGEHGSMWLEAKDLAAEISAQMGLKLPEQEIAYIQIHLIAAVGGTFSQAEGHVQIKNEFLAQQLKPFGYDDDLLSGLSVHMQSAIKRLQIHASISNPYTAQIKQNYPQAFDEALAVGDAYESKYDIKMNEDEIAYVALHLEAYMERTRMRTHQIQVALVCSTGLGTAQLLAAKVRREFPDLYVKGVWSLKDFRNADLKDVDLIISTIRLESPEVPTVLVPPIMQNEQIDLIQQYVSQIKAGRESSHGDFFQLINPELISIHEGSVTWQEAIAELGEKLVVTGHADKQVIQSAIKREQLSFTSFMEYAVPHADPQLIHQPAIAIGVFKHPVEWGEYKVKVVFFLAMTTTLNQERIDSIFDDLYGLLESKQAVSELSQAKSSNDVLNLLRGEISNDSSVR